MANKKAHSELVMNIWGETNIVFSMQSIESKL